MKKYLVTIVRTAYAQCEVEADNPEQAEEKAWDKYHPQNADSCVEEYINSVEELNNE